RLAIAEYECLIVALIRPPAATRIRNCLHDHIPRGGAVENPLQRFRQWRGRPLPAFLLVARARFVNRLRFPRDKFRHHEKLFYAALGNPDHSIRTTFFTSTARTAAIRQLRRG